MSSFVLRKIDPDFWARVQAKAKAENITIKALILKLLAQWLGILVLATIVSACGQQPFAPSGAEPGTTFVVPTVLQPVMDAIDRDPWIHPLIGEPMGAWVRQNIAGIVMDASLPATTGATFDRETHLLHWQPRNTPATHGIVKLAGIILHEARHGQGYRHDCDGHDRAMADGGAFAVQILYLEQQQFSGEAAQLRRDYIGC